MILSEVYHCYSTAITEDLSYDVALHYSRLSIPINYAFKRNHTLNPNHYFVLYVFPPKASRRHMDIHRPLNIHVIIIASCLFLKCSLISFKKWTLILGSLFSSRTTCEHFVCNGATRGGRGHP
ncbi:hypothetical protein PO909_033182 [Leuciscus waleckii]